MNDECLECLNETRKVFPSLKNKKISSDYKKMKSKKLGYVTAKIPRRLDFDPEALLLGHPTQIKNKISKPNDFKIFINFDLQRINNVALRKQILQHILIHELLHITNEDLITISKDYKRRKKKKIHVNDFEDEVFKRFNQLRRLNCIMEIQKREHLDIAIKKILDSINWFRK